MLHHRGQVSSWRADSAPPSQIAIGSATGNLDLERSNFADFLEAARLTWEKGSDKPLRMTRRGPQIQSLFSSHLPMAVELSNSCLIWSGG